MPRPRFQFRLRTLFVVVTLFSIPCAYVGWQAKIVRERERELDKALWDENNKIGFDSTGPRQKLPWIRRVFGDEYCLRINVPADTPKAEIDRLHELFPEAVIDVGRLPYPSPVPE